MQVLFSVRKEKGRESTFIPHDLGTRQKDEFDPVIQEKLECPSRNWREAFL